MTWKIEICDYCLNVDSCYSRRLAAYTEAYVQHLDICPLQRGDEPFYFQGIGNRLEGGIAVKAIQASARWRMTGHPSSRMWTLERYTHITQKHW